jgi:predicted acetyltransferase
VTRRAAPVRVGLLEASEHAILRRLYDAYLEELVGFGAAYRRRADGRWEYRPPQGEWDLDHLPYWLSDGPDRRTFLLRQARSVVGFAMVGLRPAFWMSPGIDASISEFYVVPRARGRGVGEAAARRLFRLRPGRWEIFELPANAPAIAFWRRVVGRYTGGELEELEVRGGPAQRFTSRPPRPRATRRTPRRRRSPGVARPPRGARSGRGRARGPRG